METAVFQNCSDNSIGPGVASTDCRGGFDFTVLFEESILSLLPTALFILIVPFQAIALFRRQIQIKRNTLYVYKLFGIGVYTALQLLLLITATRAHNRSDISIASAAVSFVSGLFFGFLSHVEHVKSIRPSSLISFYLIVTVVFDIARVRTRWLGRDEVVAGALTASVATKCVILCMEAMEKQSLLKLQRFSIESTSGFISRSLFWWLNPLLRDGFKRILSLDDLPAIHEKLDSERLGNKLQAHWDTCNQTRKHALAYASVWSHRLDILAIAVPKFCGIAFSISQTYLVKSAVEFVQAKDDELTSVSYGYGLIGAFALVYFGLAITTGWATHLTFRLMSMMRGELTTVIYAKLLCLPKVEESAALTLIGTDVQRIAQTFHFALIESVPSAVQLGIAIYLLYIQLGAVCIAPIVVTLVATAVSSLLTGLVTPRQTAWVEAVQRRLSYTTEILGSMRNVKMLGLTSQMFTNVQSLRDDEMETSKRYELVQALTTALANLPSIFNQLLVFAAYAVVAKVQGTKGITVSQAMASLTLLNLIDAPLGELISAVPLGWSAMGCFTRIQTFLLQDSRVDSRSIQDLATSDGSDSSTALDGTVELAAMKPSSGQYLVKVENGYFGWSDSAPEIVKGVNITIPLESKLTLVVGPIGCGKTTLLRALLGETIKARGTVSISTSRVAYCEQTPWIMNGSIRDNILSGADYDDSWYRTVIQSCALNTDFRLLREGDATIVGSKGIKLSGGQKQRISIARAIYSRSELVVCDDVLSGLDSVTEETVFSQVFGRTGILRMMNTSVIIATHSVKNLRHADRVLALSEDGSIVMQGTTSDLSLPTGYVHDLEAVNANAYDDAPTGDNTDSGSSPDNKKKDKKATDQSRKTGDWSTYKFYMHAMGWWRMAAFLLLVAVNEVFTGLQHVWLNWWATSNDNGGDERLSYWLGILTFMASMTGITLTIAICFLWVYMNPLAGSFLHRSLLKAVAGAPLAFFAATDTGTLVNRFSQDLRLADMSIPGSLTNVVFQLGSCLVVMALAISAVSYFAIALLPVTVALYFVQRFYLRTSRQLRLLEIEANAPVFTHFIESLNGLVTIRSFGWVQAFITTNKKLLDASQRPYYLLLCIQRWLVFVLDLIVAALAVVLIGLAVALRSKLDAGFLGLALVNMMSLSHALADLVQHWTSLETSFGAIARIKDFSESTPSEAVPSEDSNPDPTWPTAGSLRFERVSATYDNGATSVLQDVTFTAEKGQKIGIVGRTGSGKSSLTLAILRMLDLRSGKIFIDDIDISTLRGSVVRERLSCLTQEPLLFPATIRFNIDPWGNATDEEIIIALQKLSIWSVIQGKATDRTAEDCEVLSTVMDQEFLSHGQRQLFCLARAILKPGKLLLLDEPTSSVDAETDAKMQQVIRSDFPNHTIVMIAHRVSSLLDFDRVIVLDGGKVVELGRPAELLKQDGSQFSRLYNGSK